MSFEDVYLVSEKLILTSQIWMSCSSGWPPLCLLGTVNI